jgi:hypothetical protein
MSKHEKLICYLLFITAVVFAYTAYFGWNTIPQTRAEFWLDMISCSAATVVMTKYYSK